MAAWRPIFFSLFLRSSLLPLLSSSFCFHEGEEPVCIRVERKNRKSEGKKIESRLAALPLLKGPTKRQGTETNSKERMRETCRSIESLSFVLQSTYRYSRAHVKARYLDSRSRSCERERALYLAKREPRSFSCRLDSLTPGCGILLFLLKTFAPRPASSRKSLSRQGQVLSRLQ